MIIFLQLCILCLVALLRGRVLLGLHLEETSREPGVLSFHRTLPVARRHVGVLRESGIAFVIKRERWYHRVLKAAGVASEISLGDDRLDARYFIATDHPGHLEQVLRSEVVSRHLRELFSLPVASLHATPHRIWCVIETHDVSRPESDFAPHLDLLRKISRADTAPSAGERESSGLPSLGLLALAAVAIHAGLLMLGLFGWLPAIFETVHMPESRTLQVTGLILGAAAAFFWLLGLLFIFIGSSWVSWVLADFLLFGVIGFVLSGAYAATAANVLLPQPPAQIREMTVVQRVCVLRCISGTRRSSGYRSLIHASDRECSPESRGEIKLKARRSVAACRATAMFTYEVFLKAGSGPETVSFSPDAQMFDRFHTGSLVDVPFHPGALGIRWVDWNEVRVR
jgi:hypothetical protein